VMSGLEAAPRILALGMETRVLFFTMHQSETFVSEVRSAGAQGYVVKSQASRDLILAIDALLGGGTFFSPTDIPSGQKPAGGVSASS
jgi:DNA-binding NarL/FixJ family response regulator